MPFRKTDRIKELSINDLVQSENHPFNIYADDRLKEMMRSISQIGVRVPIIVQPFEDTDGTQKYRILSGHNRANACKALNDIRFEKIPAIIYENLTDEEAMLIVTETNLHQRSFNDLTICERGVVLKYHLEAIKNKRTDFVEKIKKLTDTNEESAASLIGTDGERSNKRVGAMFDMSPTNVARHIRLAELSKDLQKRVDYGEIGLYAGVSLSYLSADEQNILHEILKADTNKKYLINRENAEALRKTSEDKKNKEDAILTKDEIIQIISKEESSAEMKIILRIDKEDYKNYFPNNPKSKEIASDIIESIRLVKETIPGIIEDFAKIKKPTSGDFESFIAALKKEVDPMNVLNI